MPELLLERLDKGYQLIYEGRIEEASRLVEDLEKTKDLTQEEKLNCQLLKAEICSEMGKKEEQFKIAEQVFREGKKIGNILIISRALRLKWSSLTNPAISLEEGNFLYHDKVEVEHLLKSVKKTSSSEIEQSKSFLNFMKGTRFQFEGKLNFALDHFKKSLESFKRVDNFIGISLEPAIIHKFGSIYLLKGELDLALEYFNRSLTLTEESNLESMKFWNISSKNHIGEIFFQKGDLDNAIKYYKRSLAVAAQMNAPAFHIPVYYNLIKALLGKRSIEEAKQCLEQISQIIGKFKNPIDIYCYKLSEALILKSSVHIRDQAEAEKILKELIKEHDTLVKSVIQDTIWIPVSTLIEAIIQLCELYLKELEMTKGIEIIEEIQPLVERLLNESKRINSYILQAQIYLLQGKLSLLQMNIGDARQHLTQAQYTAEEHGLELLAQQISSEHDKLLEMVEGLQSFERKKITVADRLNLVSLDVILDQMQGKRALDPPELVEEEPILLLIIGQDGVSYFNHSFVENWDFDDLFSSFMSAFNKFSSEIFSKSIDRIRIDENVILIKSVESFLVCYVIKGQSYPALQKLTRFSDAIKWNTEISEALNRSMKTGQMLELNNPPSLGEVVNEIFINKR